MLPPMAAQIRKTPSHQNPAVGLYCEAGHMIIYNWMEGCIQGPIRTEPANEVLSWSRRQGAEVPTDQNLSVSLNGQTQYVRVCTWIEGGIDTAVQAEPGNLAAVGSTDRREV